MPGSARGVSGKRRPYLNLQETESTAMTEDDENELHRLCAMLREVYKGLDEQSPLREAVTKAE